MADIRSVTGSETSVIVVVRIFMRKSSTTTPTIIAASKRAFSTLSNPFSINHVCLKSHG